MPTFPFVMTFITLHIVLYLITQGWVSFTGEECGVRFCNTPLESLRPLEGANDSNRGGSGTTGLGDFFNLVQRAFRVLSLLIDFFTFKYAILDAPGILGVFTAFIKIAGALAGTLMIGSLFSNLLSSFFGRG